MIHACASTASATGDRDRVERNSTAPAATNGTTWATV